jgi:hypothetical protein
MGFEGAYPGVSSPFYDPHRVGWGVQVTDDKVATAAW